MGEDSPQAITVIFDTAEDWSIVQTTDCTDCSGSYDYSLNPSTYVPSEDSSFLQYNDLVTASNVS